MSRWLLLVGALGGCDRVFGLERDSGPPVCGPFHAPTEVMFSPALGNEVHDLSVDTTGTLGMVYANVGNPPTGAWRGPHAVKLDPTGMWIQDTARDTAILDNLDGGHIAFSGTEAFGWLDKPRGPMANLLRFTAAWDSVATEVIDDDTDRDIHMGNVIDLPVGPGLVQRFAVEIRLPFDRLGPGELRVIQRIPTSTFWMVTGQATNLNTAKPTLDLNGGALTADHEILVYTAKVGAEDMSRAFATRRERDTYGPGVELIIDGLASDASITEPWINEDCTMLYFRENDTTWMAEAVAP